MSDKHFDDMTDDEIRAMVASAPAADGSYLPCAPVGRDCAECHCCPADACEPGEPLGPGVCGHTCSCHPDFWREMYDEHFPGVEL